VNLVSGYRYPFYFYTTIAATEISVTLYLEDSAGSESVLGSDSTETCNTSYCNDLSASRYAECLVPHPTATPKEAGEKGLLFTEHILTYAEEWEVTTRSIVSGALSRSPLLATSGHIIGFSGSYICEKNGTHTWGVIGNNLYWRFKCSSIETGDEEGEKSYTVDMTSGFRYAFRLLLSAPADSWDLGLQITEPGATSPKFLSDADCETAEVDGCANINAKLEEGCAVDEESGESDNTVMIIIVAVVVVVVVIIVVIIIIVVVRRKKKKAIEDSAHGHKSSSSGSKDNDKKKKKKEKESHESKGSDEAPVPHHPGKEPDSTPIGDASHTTKPKTTEEDGRGGHENQRPDGAPVYQPPRQEGYQYPMGDGSQMLGAMMREEDGRGGYGNYGTYGGSFYQPPRQEGYPAPMGDGSERPRPVVTEEDGRGGHENQRNDGEPVHQPHKE
jgi:hypothetical protein